MKINKRHGIIIVDIIDPDIIRYYYCGYNRPNRCLRAKTTLGGPGLLIAKYLNDRRHVVILMPE